MSFFKINLMDTTSGYQMFKKEILKKEKNFIKRGGKFITHTPKVQII